ncbi:putative membrane protein At3g27390 isoform X1 [Castanea sativa]|uniref:putative membrane protein At3g27390 isoform X1 n=1 Tax=Castanea sativa TaxID=21020 RepID=UPI003F64BF93
MEVPVGFLRKLWSFLSFLPFFLLLLVLGLLKAALVGPVVVGIIFIGNSAVIIGLWTAHFVWTYYCVAKTKKLGLVLKILVLVSLPVPLVLWPIFGIVGCLLGGVGYGFFAPLLATFEAVGENVTEKFYHCFVDGCWSTIKGACIVVQDFTDFCFHSYFSYMDELIEKVLPDEKPMDIKLSKLPSCLLASLIGIPVDVLLITAVALWKSPYMLLRGWKRLLEDLIGREGPFLETVCVPFAGLAIILWPLAVVGAVIVSIISSFFLGLYSGVIVHQEDSLQMGLAYIVSVVSLFDEYVNDLLYLREGSRLPRPKYRKNMSPSPEREKLGDNGDNDSKNGRESSYNSKLISERSRTLKWGIQQYKPVQVWDWLFKSCEVNGRILLRDGLLTPKDIEECILKGNCKKLGIKLPAWSILQCLLASAKANSSGLVISDDVELTRMNVPKDKVFEWFIGPLLIMKEQLKKLQLNENEEMCLRELVMTCKNEKPEEWDDTEFASSDKVRRAQLQSIIRRLQGIVASMSRVPTFRRRFRNLVKVLYIEAIQEDASGNHMGGILKAKYGNKSCNQSEDKKEIDETINKGDDKAHDCENLV